MIATESFIWINYPKAASTFVRECLKTLYTAPSWNFRKKKLLKGRFMKELALPNIRAVGTRRYGSPTPHGLVRQIPSQYSHLPIALSVRDPAERLLSLFYYGDWKKPEANRFTWQDIKNRFPDFPNLVFADFIKLWRSNCQNRSLIIGKKTIAIGAQSLELINFITPACFINSQGNFEFPDWISFISLINSCTFLKSSNIDEDLYFYLLRHGFKSRDLQFIVSKGKVNVSNKSYIEVPSSATDVLNTEWLLQLLNSADGKVNAEQLQEVRSRSL